MVKSQPEIIPEMLGIWRLGEGSIDQMLPIFDIPILAQYYKETMLSGIQFNAIWRQKIPISNIKRLLNTSIHLEFF